MKIKLFFRKDFRDESKRAWGLCILTIDGIEHATGDIRAVYGESDQICVATSTNGLNKHGTIREHGPYSSTSDLENSKYFECKEIEAEVIEKEWNRYGISHTYLKHKDIAL